MGKVYTCAGLGGTFDHFHSGHKKFIEFAARKARHLVIGITDEKMSLSKLNPQSIERLSKRVSNVKEFAQSLHISFETIVLHDLFGNTLEDQRITALVATNETLSGCEQINETRLKLGLKSLPIELCQMVLDESGKELHSDRIRAGLINREGVVYQKLLEKNIVISDPQRQFFGKLQGKIVEQPTMVGVKSKDTKQSASPTIVVGDATLANFIQYHWPYDIAIFDQQIQRQKTFLVVPTKENLETVKNPAGQITLKLSQQLFSLIHKRTMHSNSQYLEIAGEEDLATVVAVLLAPLGSYIYYGQPNQGLVEIVVTEQIKEKFANALQSK